ncbi:MAG TPA: methyltransferase domain-containing protein, partial [Myxococcota bacterium]|nr:methyltransferase domain-containing protein [Myxococcota bacterium]
VGGRFDLAVSFQVVEHLADPAPFVAALADALRPGGVALVSTPNRLQSDGENPFHVHEYRADELERLLAARFGSVEMLGVGVRGEALRYHEDRLRRIRRIVRLDPLRLRRRIPRSLVEWLFARFAILVRRGLAADARLPQISLADFPIGPVDPGSLDLLAVCRDPLP